MELLFSFALTSKLPQLSHAPSVDFCDEIGFLPARLCSTVRQVEGKSMYDVVVIPKHPLTPM